MGHKLHDLINGIAALIVVEKFIYLGHIIPKSKHESTKDELNKCIIILLHISVHYLTNIF